MDDDAHTDAFEKAVYAAAAIAPSPVAKARLIALIGELAGVVPDPADD